MTTHKCKAEEKEVEQKKKNYRKWSEVTFKQNFESSSSHKKMQILYDGEKD